MRQVSRLVAVAKNRTSHHRDVYVVVIDPISPYRSCRPSLPPDVRLHRTCSAWRLASSSVPPSASDTMWPQSNAHGFSRRTPSAPMK